MRIAIAALLVPAALATAIAMVLLAPWEGFARSDSAASAGPRVPGHVTAATEVVCDDAEGGGADCVALSVVLTGGPASGQTLETVVSKIRGVAPYGAGDDVVLVQAGEPNDLASYDVVDFQRGDSAAGAGTPVRGRGGGAGPLARARRARRAGLGSGVVLVAFVLPAILAGRDPLAVAVTGACGSCSCPLPDPRLLGPHVDGGARHAGRPGADRGARRVFVRGRADHRDRRRHAGLPALGAPGADLRGLALAGIVIGGLGVLDDVTVTQASAVWELRAVDPTMRRARSCSPRDADRPRPRRVVGEHAGARLRGRRAAAAAAVLGGGARAADTLTAEVIAEEVVRTLVGSIGIVASVPITTALAVAVVTRR